MAALPPTGHQHLSIICQDANAPCIYFTVCAAILLLTGAGNVCKCVCILPDGLLFLSV